MWSCGGSDPFEGKAIFLVSVLTLLSVAGVCGGVGEGGVGEGGVGEGGATDGGPQDTVQRVDLSAIGRQHEQTRKRTSREYRQAAFVCPAPDPDASIPLSMVPLIVQEFPKDPADIERSFFRFGALSVNRAGVPRVRQDQQTVYFERSKITVRNRARDQLTFVWFYPPALSGRQLRFRGLRVTPDDRGFPAIYEVLSSDAACRKVYVSKRLEQAARKQYGAPLSGRRFAIEPSLQKQPNVVVPRVVGEGPLPMGPFVYLDASGLRVTTLICRCESSQVAEFADSSHYQLRECSDLSAIYPGDFPPDEMLLPTGSDDFDLILRLPSEF